jgi:hypothetical protein
MIPKKACPQALRGREAFFPATSAERDYAEIMRKQQAKAR